MIFFCIFIFSYNLFGWGPGNSSSGSAIIDLNTPANNKKQVIILKSDDFVLSDQWKRYIQYIENKQIKACLGVVAKELFNESLCVWSRSLLKKNNFEFWNHGLTHDCGDHPEFKGSSYEEQLDHIRNAQKIFKDNLGITPLAFGAPCNMIDENTSRALIDIEDIKIWLYGKKGWSGITLERWGNIEVPTGHPDYQQFVENYDQGHWEQYDCLVFQIHPGWWEDRRWEEFEKIIDFLTEKEVIFMTCAEYYQSITTTITVTNQENNGSGSLRAAIDMANSNNLENAVIILPAGTYYLSGLKGENNNAGGDLDIFANLTIRGADAASTIIDGNHNDRVFHIHSGRINITGVTIRNGRAGSGGGIRVDGGIVAMSDCLITKNTVADEGNLEEIGGGGVYIANAKITISGCTISENTGDSAAEIKGGGVYIRQSRSYRTDIRNSLLESNTGNKNPGGTGRGGGLYLMARNPNFEVKVINNTFRNNIAGTGELGEGGGVYFADVGNAHLERNRFLENSASVEGNGRGGAIFVSGETVFSMTNNLLVNNNASQSGSGIHISGSAKSVSDKSIAGTMMHNTLADNYNGLTGTSGEGIFVGDDVILNLINNLIMGHTTGINIIDTTGSSTVNADYNLFYNDSDPVVGTNALLQDPMLTSEFKPMENSPVIDAGEILEIVARDLDGHSRPQGNGYDIGCYEYIPGLEPLISLDRTLLNFATCGTYATDSQLFRVSNSGTGVLDWTATANESWIQVNPSNGRGSGIVSVTIDPDGLTMGTYNGTISIADSLAGNSPQTVNINLTVYKPGLMTAPFGEFAVPAEGTTGVTGSIPLSGWALDNIGVEKVEIYLEQEKKLIFVDEAIFVEGARPDVEQAYPGYPYNYKAGWGYMLLTYFLPHQGNGTYTFHALATDCEGNRFTLGTKTITCSNADAVKPFGSIDIPVPGGTGSGKSFAHWGWVLTPSPNQIPIDGSTINVWVDGVNLGHPIYNIYRGDIAGLFPGYFNSEGPAGYFYLNTTVYENGIHTIQWTAEDTAGNKDGIGSRYFFIQNIGGLYDPQAARDFANSGFKRLPIKKEDFQSLPVDHYTPVEVLKGYRKHLQPQRIYPADAGIIHIKIKELEPVEIRFPYESAEITGFMRVGSQFKSLPVGSTLDVKTKTFCWQPGPGFVGGYRMNFIVKEKNGEMKRMDVVVEILMKF